jgi:protein-tyrosine phosphatase-like protein
MADSTDQYEAGAMIRRAIDVLCDEFSGIFSPETVDRYVMESFESLKRSRVQTFRSSPRDSPGTGCALLVRPTG